MKVSKKFKGAKFAFLLVMLFAISIAFLSCGDNPPDVVIEGEIPEGVPGGGGNPPGYVPHPEDENPEVEEGPGEGQVTVSIRLGRDTYDSVDKYVDKGATLQKPTDLTRESTDKVSYRICDFYTDDYYDTLFDFTQPINENITIYASWYKSGTVEDIQILNEFEFVSDSTYIFADETYMSDIVEKLKAAEAKDSTLRNITLDLSKSNGGTFDFKNCKSIKNVKFSSDFTQKFKRIEESMFEGCENLVSVTVCELSYIGTKAFSGCKKLETILNKINQDSAYDNGFVLDDIGDEAFKDCEKFNSYIEFTNFTNYTGQHGPENSIGVGAFENCKSLKSVYLSRSCKKVGERTFKGCSSLTNDKSLLFIESSHDMGLKNIGANAFEGCSSLVEINLSEIITIGKEAFKDCTSLEDVTKLGYNSGSPNQYIGFSTLEEGVFSGCTKLVRGFGTDKNPQGEVIFRRISPDLKEIKANAFEGCSSLKEIDTVDVKKIAVDAFKGCTGLEEVTTGLSGLSEVVKYAKSNLKKVIIPYTFNADEIAANTFDGCTSLENITLASDVKITKIGDSAFNGCSKLDSTVVNRILQDVTEIGNNAFSGCSAILSITIPGTVTTIGNNAFSDCTKISNLTIPQAVTTIGESVFSGWTSNQKIAVSWTDSNRPVDWDENWMNGCNAKITNNSTGAQINPNFSEQSE